MYSLTLVIDQVSASQQEVEEQRLAALDQLKEKAEAHRGEALDRERTGWRIKGCIRAQEVSSLTQLLQFLLHLCLSAEISALQESEQTALAVRKDHTCVVALQ